PNMVRILLWLATGRYLADPTAEVTELFERARDVVAETRGDRDVLMAEVIGGQGTYYMNMGSFDLAEPLLRDSVEICEEALGEASYEGIRALRALAYLTLIKGEAEEAFEMQIRVVKLSDQSLGPMHPRMADTLMTLAEMFQNRNEQLEAVALARRALTIRRKTFRGPEVNQIATLERLGRSLFITHREKEAIAAVEEALQMA